MNKGKLTLVLLILSIYFLSTGISYALFSNMRSSSSTTVPTSKNDKTGAVALQDDTLPKTEACPLNGALYSSKRKEWWDQHRPLGVMIENHEESRPQSGLSFADVIYEAVAEGGITRFLAIYYCQDADPIGAVRSARTYFLDFISEYGNSPLYTHVGGANTPGPANALGQIDDYGWGGYNDLNQFSIGFPTFWRDYDRLGHTVATEHTMYSSTTKLWNFAKKSRDLTNVDKNDDSWDEGFVKYSFKEDESEKARGNNKSLQLEFWKGYSQYFITWEYDKAQNIYKRVNGGKPHLDKNTNKQLTAKNIVVLLMSESNANDGYENNLHLLYKTKGTGKAHVFMDGKDIQGTWKKEKRTSRTLIFDQSGNPIKLNRGVIWFEILPTTGVISVK